MYFSWPSSSFTIWQAWIVYSPVKLELGVEGVMTRRRRLPSSFLVMPKWREEFEHGASLRVGRDPSPLTDVLHSAGTVSMLLGRMAFKE
jgi:hypothetical protein